MLLDSDEVWITVLQSMQDTSNDVFASKDSRCMDNFVIC